MSRYIIGLMSGTSVDGVDAAIVEITGFGTDTSVRVVKTQTFPYPARLRKAVLNASSETKSSVYEVCLLNFLIGEFFADCAKKIAGKSKIGLSNIRLIGSHGQTIFHIPDLKKRFGYETRATLQIGEPSVIAERTGITTVADFRPRDIAAGGMGAPLTSYVHYLLFHRLGENLLVLNIGGIGNITAIPSNCKISSIMGFDTGPGNMVLDYVTSKLTGGKKTFDNKGRIAQKGNINAKLLTTLMKNPYIRKDPPKTTGRELFGSQFGDHIIHSARSEGINKEDLLATLTEFTAETILYSYRQFVLPRFQAKTLIVCGGGARNHFLIGRLKDKFTPVIVKTTDDFQIPSDFFEAVAFAILANETIHTITNNAPSVTGAKRHVIMGKIVPGRNFTCTI